MNNAPSQPTAARPPAMAKWDLPKASPSTPPAPSQGGSSRFAAASEQGSSWSMPSPPRPLGGSERPPNLGKWAAPAPAPAPKLTIPDKPAAVPSSQRPPLSTQSPQHLKPPSYTPNKWQRPEPHNLEANTPTRSRPLPRSPPENNYLRPDRSPAPHQAPRSENTINSRPKPSSQGQRENNHLRHERGPAPHQIPHSENTINSRPRPTSQGQSSTITHQRTNSTRTNDSRPPEMRTNHRYPPPPGAQQRPNSTERTYDSRPSEPQRNNDFPTSIPPGKNKASRSSLFAADGDDRKNRPNRALVKERGSLMGRLDEQESERRSKNSSKAQIPESSKSSKTKNKVYVEKRVSPDVYIPTTVSVETLARLLGVRLGKWTVLRVCLFGVDIWQNACSRR